MKPSYIETMSDDERAKVVDEIIRRYGPVIDLRTDPLVIIDILISYRAEEEPGHPTTGSIARDGSILPDILDNIAKLSQTVEAMARDLSEIKAKLRP
jgi:hypothetical protein